MAEGDEVELVCDEHDHVPTTGQQDQLARREKGSSLLLQLGEKLDELTAEQEPESYLDSLGRDGTRPHDGASYDWTLPGSGAELEQLLARAFAAGVRAQDSTQRDQATDRGGSPSRAAQDPPIEATYRVEDSPPEGGESPPQEPPDGGKIPSTTILEAVKHGAAQATQVVEPGQKCLILQGIPASGKSTWARALVMADPSYKRVNRDEIRNMLHGGVWSKSNEKLTKDVQLSSILNAFSAGYNVIIDDTNLSPKHLRTLRSNVSQEFPNVGWKTIRFNIPLMEALRRNQARPAHERVPDHVIRRMWIEYNNYQVEI